MQKFTYNKKQLRYPVEQSDRNTFVILCITDKDFNGNCFK